jgi:hypothetical protein
MDTLGILAPIALAIYAYVERQKRLALERARDEYRRSITRLKQEPTNADRKQEALALGRVYSNMTRERKGVTLFDEIALLNDINAACAAASVSQHVAAIPPQSVEERLRVLVQLRDGAMIDETEYDKQRRQILESI